MKRPAFPKTPAAITGILRVQAHQRIAKVRKCVVCRAPFDPILPVAKVCSVECAVVHARLLREKGERRAAKAERAADKAKLEQYKPLSYWEAITERHCNAYIRARDPDVCISCGVTHSSAWQAGHYIAVGANSTLRYHEDNIHKQCIQCNMFKGSNAIPYREGLLAKIGVERLAWLEGWHPPIKMTAASAQEIAAMYRAKLKELQA